MNSFTADFLPHAGPMKFIDEMLQLSPDGHEATLKLTLEPNKHYFDETQTFHSTWMIEILAQGAAGLFYFQKGGSGKPEIGFLVGIEELTIQDTHLKPGDELLIQAKLITDFHPFGVYAVEAFHGQSCIAHGEFKFMRQEGLTH